MTHNEARAFLKAIKERLTIFKQVMYSDINETIEKNRTVKVLLEAVDALE